MHSNKLKVKEILLSKYLIGFLMLSSTTFNPAQWIT